MRLPGLTPADDLLFFGYRPKKPKEKKSDPQSGPLRGSLKKLKEPENLETSRLRRRRTSRFFRPSPPAFSSPARTGWEIKPESDAGEALHQPARRRSESAPVLCFHPVLAEVRSAGTQTAGRLFFAYFLLTKQKKASCCRATPGKPSKSNCYKYKSHSRE